MIEFSPLRLNILFAPLLLGVLIATSASAGNAYRWHDEQGNMVVSDRPPEHGIEYETISTSTGRAIEETPESAAPSASRQPAPEPKPKSASKPPTNSQVFAPKKDEKLCSQARNNMRVLEDGPRIRFTDEDGVVRFLTDEERAVEKVRTNDAITAYCDN